MKNVLLTGGTGFVGIHLLQQLLMSPHIGTVYILCRYSVTIAAKRYGLDLYDPVGKMTSIAGDITQPRLGLDNNIYDEICQNVDIIYHVAAKVNHILPYEVLKPVNVDSTAALLIMARKAKPKIVNFVSTLGAATRVNAKGIILEDFPGTEKPDSNMGYLISKWASEQLIAEFHAAGHAANIQRLGYITGHSHTGVSLCEHNQLMLLIKSCIQLGYAPRLSRLINMTPVDITAAIMNLPEFHFEGGHVVNVINTTEYISWNDLITWFSQYYPIKLIDFTVWQQKIKTIDEDNALFRFLPLYTHQNSETTVLRFATNILQYETQRTRQLLEKYDIAMPSLQNNLLDKYYHYLVQSKFLPDTGV